MANDNFSTPAPIQRVYTLPDAVRQGILAGAAAIRDGAPVRQRTQSEIYQVENQRLNFISLHGSEFGYIL